MSDRDPMPIGNLIPEVLEPIKVDCEGSEIELRLPGVLGGVCQMCGQWFPSQVGGVAPKHRRQDVLAMIERGDFG